MSSTPKNKINKISYHLNYEYPCFLCFAWCFDVTFAVEDTDFAVTNDTRNGILK